MGQKRLQKAIDHFTVNGKLPVEVEWKPYQIDPGTETNGEEFNAYCERRWGGSGWTQHLQSEGVTNGARFSNWKWWPNTLRGHQWIMYGKEKHGLDTSKANAVFLRALYEQGENLSDTETLIRLAENTLPEVDVADLRDYITKDKGAAKVMQEIDQGRRAFGIQGVPCFVVGATGLATPYAFSGAQASESFLEVFEELSEKLKD